MKTPKLSDPNQTHVIEGLEALDFCGVRYLLNRNGAVCGHCGSAILLRSLRSLVTLPILSDVTSVLTCGITTGVAKEDWAIIQMLRMR
ncbi:hypothetical protein OK016_02570 [Vibrio chagasii]|nr:hypothetical protein [Vibrio chagasii]